MVRLDDFKGLSSFPSFRSGKGRGAEAGVPGDRQGTRPASVPLKTTKRPETTAVGSRL
jgi:hypothetical protein